MKKFNLMVMMLVCSACCMAATTFVNGLFTYRVLNVNEVEVVYGIQTLEGEVVIPVTATDNNMGGTYTVTAIGDGAFVGQSGITAITIPETVTSIGRSSFKDCSGLEEIWLPDGIEEIPFEAFSGCAALDTVAFPENLKTIGMWAFKGCAMKRMALPESIESIGDAAFEGCTNLIKAVIPDGCTDVGNLAFKGCTSLKSLGLPDNLLALNYGIVSGCTVLRQLTIPSGVTEMNDVGEGASLRSIFCTADSIYPGLKNQTLHDGYKIGLYVYRDVYDKQIYQKDTTWTKKFRIGWAVPISTNSSTVTITQSDGSTKQVSYASLSREFNLDFTTEATEDEVHVYYASSVDADRTEVGMEEVKKVPAYTGDDFTGVVVEGLPNKTYYYAMARPEENADVITHNYMVGAAKGAWVEPTSIDAVSGEKKTNYGLSKGAFRRFSCEGFIDSGKAYLSLPSVVAGNAKEYKVTFIQDDGTTHVASLEDMQNSMNDGHYYDVSGMAHENAVKGINIRGGKKFVNVK